MKHLKEVLLFSSILFVVLAGCQKKVLKTEPVPEEPAVVAPEPEPYQPSDDDVFTPMDMDAQLKEVFRTIYFEFDSYDLRPEALARLEDVAKFMREHKSVRVLAEGHCDERGSSEYNMGLGEKRAKAARSYLVSYGISGNRIETTSYGEEQTARSGCADDACHGENRRVEWKILAK